MPQILTTANWKVHFRRSKRTSRAAIPFWHDSCVNGEWMMKYYMSYRFLHQSWLLNTKLLHSGVLVILFLGTLPALQAANWYVDNAARGANNGTSWANAWTDMTKVIWGAS